MASKTLVIARGLPGSGKSTAIETHGALQDWHDWTGNPPMNWLASADDYWGYPYKFEPALLKEAHQYCQLTAKVGMRWQAMWVYVDNTNIRRKDYQIYIDLAKEFGYYVKFLESITPWAWDVDECFKRCVHNVPKEKIQQMKDNWEIDLEFETIRLSQ